MTPEQATQSATSDGDAFGIIVALIVLAVFAWLLLTLHRAAAAVPDPERRFRPGLVWLAVIPFFNTVWWFVVVCRIPQSIAGALHRREERRGDCGRDIGLVFATLGAVATVLLLFGGSLQAIGRDFVRIGGEKANAALNAGGSIQGLGVLLLLAAIACFAVFVAKVHGAARRLAELDAMLDETS
ncbi:MAG: hypothetical protein GY741_09205 [Phycisphaeraceae bacterium]|nr:hypothetical protein [Phycisphaeraceae bacterium]